MGDYGEESFNKITGTAKEIIAIFEQAAMAKGDLQGYLADSVLKTIKKGGFESKEVSLITIPDEELKEDYFNALTREQIPFLVVQDVFGKESFYIHSENRDKVKNIDALIKKTSQKITRRDYIIDFLKDHRRLEHKVIKLNLSSNIDTDILTGKAFQNNYGFVSSIANGSLYVDAKDIDNDEFLNIVSDSFIASAKSDSLYSRCKRAQKAGESAVEYSLTSEIDHPSHNKMYYVNSENPNGIFATIQDGIICLYDENKQVFRKIDATKLPKESKLDAVQNVIGQINNCTIMQEMDAGQWFQDFNVNSQTYADRLANFGEAINDIKHGRDASKFTVNNYLQLGTETLFKVSKVIHERKTKTEAELSGLTVTDSAALTRLMNERDHLDEVYGAVNDLLHQKEIVENLKRELRKRSQMQLAAENLRMQAMTLDQRLERRGEIYRTLLKTDDVTKDFKAEFPDIDLDEIGDEIVAFCISLDEVNYEAELTAIKNSGMSSSQQATSTRTV